MNRNATRALLGALALGTAATASADVINITQNADVTTPVVTYVSDSAGYPTPLQEVTSSYNQTLFSATDSIYAAEMFDLQALDSVADEIYGSQDTISWHAVWYDPMGVQFAYNLVEINWSDILDWQAAGNEAVTFWTDDSATGGSTLASGTYTVVTYVEGQASNFSTFDVPEPSSLLLMSLGLLAVGYRATRKS